MKMIIRENYLNLLYEYQDKPFIKVITGMRRVGKSVLMDQFVESLKAKGVSETQICKINFELPTSFDITDYKTLTQKVLDFRGKNQQRIYLFLDEIQRVKDWEKAVNGFHALNAFDIYITGSNANLLSSQLSTYLAGRYVEIKVHPFSYREFKALHAEKHLDEKTYFNQYLIFGGIPSIGVFNLDYELSMNALRDSFKSAFFRDVVLINQIRNTIVLDRLINYLLSNTGKTFSALSISNFFKAEQIKASVDTILSYLQYIEEAYLITKVKRQDLNGKAILKTDEKYYIEDHGIREAVVGGNQQSIELILENIVFNQLNKKGYKVYVGKNKEYEVDFVCVHPDKSRSYYQVAYLLASEETRKREFRSLLLIDDQYPKYVLSLDQINFSEQGVKHMNLIDFLNLPVQ
jgi:hypothetical protein